MAMPTASTQSASLVTSRCTYVASPPCCRIASSTCFPASSRRSPSTTFAPSRAKSWASTAPWPRAPPLISATFPSSLPMAPFLLLPALAPCPYNIGGSVLPYLLAHPTRRPHGLTQAWDANVAERSQQHCGAFLRSPILLPPCAGAGTSPDGDEWRCRTTAV